MSVNMTIHLAYPLTARHEINCKDLLRPDQEYVFFGHIIDMSWYRETYPSIPEKPFIHLEPVALDQKIMHGDNTEQFPNGQNYYFCKAGDFKNVPENIATTQKNNAVIAFFKALKPEEFILVEMSW